MMHLSHARICLAATPQRNDANFVVTTRRCFDDGARGANGELDTAANRKHAGTLTQRPSMLNASTLRAERAPETFPETYYEMAVTIRPQGFPHLHSETMPTVS